MELNPEIRQKIAETQKLQSQQDAVGLKAATSALPGPTRDVFAIAASIQVGKYEVRRFVDRDFVFLSLINHPLNRLSAVSDGSYDFSPSGPLAWELFWIMTKPVSEAKAKFKEGTEKVKEAAADEFGDMQIFALAKLMEAVVKQMHIYAGGVLEFEQKSEGENGSNPPQPSSQ